MSRRLAHFRTLMVCFGLLAFSLTSCSSLPNPSHDFSAASAEAAEVLELSAKQAGHPWKRCRKVTVAFSGQWTGIVKKLQPELVDAGFRGTSKETYLPRLNRVEQEHSGPKGTKHVTRTHDDIVVDFNGLTSGDKTANDAAALVADAYTIFLFGSDYLLSRGSDWALLRTDTRHRIEGKPCWLLSGTLRPGIGRSSEDRVIAWVCQQDHRLLRVQFTLAGLESTRGADADVTFSDIRPGPWNAEFPHHFVETIRRPLTVKAHDWRITNLSAE